MARRLLALSALVNIGSARGGHARVESGRATENGAGSAPSTLIVDAHSLNSRNGGEAIGVDGNKKVHGRKNQMLTDTLGLVWGVPKHAANLSDTYEAQPLSHLFLPLLPRAKRVFIDKNYRGTAVAYLACIDSAPPTIPDQGLGEKGGRFQPEPLRWYVEHAIAWVTDCRRLGAFFERTISSCEGFAWLAGCYVALGKLAGRKAWVKKRKSIIQLSNALYRKRAVIS